jgi:Pyridoxamine 5'-phosphate oxidase
MTAYEIKSEFAVTDEKSLRELFPATHTLAALKSLSKLDSHARDFIQRSPFLCIGTQNKDGKADVSPRGDPAGFVQILTMKRWLYRIGPAITGWIVWSIFLPTPVSDCCLSSPVLTTHYV